jgi:multidrug resistance efflux pump
VARAELQAALEDFELWNEGPNPAELALAEKRLANAQAAADATRAELNNLELRAPFDGVIAELNVHPGEWVTQGEAVVEVADLAHLRVETSDLSERDIPHIAEGRTVTVFIEALGEEVAGRVSEIAPLADTLGGDVVYRTTIDLDSMPSGLRAGMSVEVHFNAD